MSLETFWPLKAFSMIKTVCSKQLKVELQDNSQQIRPYSILHTRNWQFISDSMANNLISKKDSQTLKK